MIDPDSTILDIFVAMEPVAKARPRITKAGHAYTPSSTTKAEHRIQQQASEAYGRLAQEGPLSVVITAYLVKPKSKPKTRPCRPTSRPDVDNYAKLVLDALNGIVWRDDAQVCRLFTEKLYCSELHPHPGFRIVVHAMDGGATPASRPATAGSQPLLPEVG